ncbi:MAG: protein-L-isoaspartate(D-aspartate) O-methyltransferase [Pseudomonadales bacterium]|jgi:protein-L-isoaspartate(D-aspartate) O-methyltransferase|nr:protein-L-isoaspartate(D-aspartate) O-methyltransferase [Pseudomonadales bacterium]
MNERQHHGIGMTSARTRERMVQRLGDQGIRNLRVMDAMLQVPRHLFVEEAFAQRAYEDVALPIAFKQTISQPYIVARMTELLLAGLPENGGKVLEIGTGCGYQTAVLAYLLPQVYSIERIEGLANRARQRLRELRVNNIKLRYGDGYLGWPGAAPFDGIMITAAAPQLPPALVHQLADGGVIVLPEGQRRQVLKVYKKHGDALREASLEEVSFVPLVPGLPRR